MSYRHYLCMIQREQTSKSDELNPKKTSQAPMETTPTLLIPTIQTPNNQPRTTMTIPHNPKNTTHPVGQPLYREPTAQHKMDPTNSPQPMPYVTPHLPPPQPRAREAATSLHHFEPDIKKNICKKHR